MFSQSCTTNWCSCTLLLWLCQAGTALGSGVCAACAQIWLLWLQDMYKGFVKNFPIVTIEDPFDQVRLVASYMHRMNMSCVLRREVLFVLLIADFGMRLLAMKKFPQHYVQLTDLWPGLGSERLFKCVKAELGKHEKTASGWARAACAQLCFKNVPSVSVFAEQHMIELLTVLPTIGPCNTLQEECIRLEHESIMHIAPCTCVHMQDLACSVFRLFTAQAHVGLASPHAQLFVHSSLLTEVYTDLNIIDPSHLPSGGLWSKHGVGQMHGNCCMIRLSKTLNPLLPAGRLGGIHRAQQGGRLPGCGRRPAGHKP